MRPLALIAFASVALAGLVYVRQSQAAALDSSSDPYASGDQGYTLPPWLYGDAPDLVGELMPSSSSGGEITSADGEGGASPLLDALLPVAYKAKSVFGMGLNMYISFAGLAAIKQREGYSATAYKDQAGYWTIGYGHKMKAGETYTTIDEATASKLLASDVTDAELAVNGAVTVPLEQTQYDALVSFAYNVGAGAFRSSTLVRLLNAGDYAGAAAQFPRWSYVTQGGQKVQAQGLLNRRYAEAQQFNGVA